jgi:hypothetical protein
MLSNSLSLDEEEAVQKELLELQQDIVRPRRPSHLNDSQYFAGCQVEGVLEYRTALNTFFQTHGEA